MTDLDDKLRTVLKPWAVEMTDDVIAQIKQAFEDAGYSLLTPQERTAVMKWRDGAFMTGAEWYSRYYKEIHKVVMPGGNREAIEVYHDCDKAARKAAGL